MNKIILKIFTKFTISIFRLSLLKSNHFKHRDQHFKASFGKRFGKQIRHIVICVDLLQMNELPFKAAADKMNFDIDVLGLGMLNQLFDHLDGSIIVTKDRCVKKLQTVV